MVYLFAARPSLLHSHNTSSADFRYCAAVSFLSVPERVLCSMPIVQSLAGPA